jgi:hypothetical protein
LCHRLAANWLERTTPISVAASSFAGRCRPLPGLADLASHARITRRAPAAAPRLALPGSAPPPCQRAAAPCRALPRWPGMHPRTKCRLLPGCAGPGTAFPRRTATPCGGLANSVRSDLRRANPSPACHRLRAGIVVLPAMIQRMSFGALSRRPKSCPVEQGKTEAKALRFPEGEWDTGLNRVFCSWHLIWPPGK